MAPVSEPLDRKFLDAALRLARRNQGQTGTNPSVACLIVRVNDNSATIVGRGITAKGGRPHAEPLALAEAGELANGATAYVTLEPCAHHGRTPPCAQALIDAGISRVVTAISDPDQRVNGKGHDMLAAAGVSVTMLDCGAAAKRPITGYLSHRNRGRPHVTLKLATAADGTMGSRKYGNLRITGPESKAQVHLLRARHQAILVGSGTLLADDPMLTCRLPGLEDRSPIRIILDAIQSSVPTHRVVETANQFPTLITVPIGANSAWTGKMKAASVELISADLHEGRIALPELLDDLAARGIQSLMVEGGAAVASAFLGEQLVDEICWFIGGEPDRQPEKEDRIMAPFSEKSPPRGFENVEELVFGSDKFIRMVKEG